MNKGIHKSMSNDSMGAIINDIVRFIIVAFLVFLFIGISLSTIILIPVAALRTFYNFSWIEMSVLGFSIPEKLSLILPIITAFMAYGIWRVLDKFLEYKTKKQNS